MEMGKKVTGKNNNYNNNIKPKKSHNENLLTRYGYTKMILLFLILENHEIVLTGLIFAIPVATKKSGS